MSSLGTTTKEQKKVRVRQSSPCLRRCSMKCKLLNVRSPLIGHSSSGFQKPINKHGILRGWLLFGANFKEYGYGGHHDCSVKIFGTTLLFSRGCSANFWIMDEKIIRLCEENNVPSLVQVLSTLKNQKVCVISLVHSAALSQF